MSAAVSQREFARLADCDEKQVRRAVASGKLVADAKGLLDASQVGGGWRRPRRDSKPEKPAHAADDGRLGPRPTTAPPPAIEPSANRLKAAVERKEDFAGRLKEIEYLQKAGSLIELDLARRVLFSQFRAARDAWQNWPSKYAALIASDLGVDPGRVLEVLSVYVHRQLAALGDPSGEFGEG